jgi:glycerophosphoryl diester phosphodiesterase
MQIIGHRGAPAVAPENTLSSFRKALEMRVVMIELDVYALKSGELVVIHDDKVDRTTDGSGYITDFSLTALRRLDAGNGEKIPLLAEVLNLVDKTVPVNIELKGIGTAKPVAELLMRYIRDRGWTTDRFIVSSFNHIELKKFHQLMPQIRTGALIVGIPVDYAAFAEKLGAYSVNPSAEFVTPEYVQDAHNRGLKVFAFTVNDQSEIRRMDELKVDGIFTNVPDQAFSYLQSAGAIANGPHLSLA